MIINIYTQNLWITIIFCAYIINIEQVSYYYAYDLADDLIELDSINCCTR